MSFAPAGMSKQNMSVDRQQFMTPNKPPVQKPMLPQEKFSLAPKAYAADYPLPKGTPDIKKNIDSWRKIQDDTDVANKAYDMDPEFRKKVDFFSSRLEEMDEETRNNLPTLLLNQHYYGSWQPEFDDVDPLELELEAQIAARAKNPGNGFFSKLGEMINAPGDLMTGVAMRGIEQTNLFGMGDLASRTDESMNLSENAQKTKENLANYGAMAGSAFGPAGTFAGTALGSGLERAIDTATGQREVDNSMFGLKQLAGDVAAPVMEGAVVGTVDRATMGLGKWVGKSGISKATKQYLTERIPAKMINTILRPPTKEFNFGKDPGRAVVQEKITAPTRGALLNRIVSRKKQIGSSLETKILAASKGKGTKKQIDMTESIVKPIKEAMTEARRTNNKPLNNALADLLDQLTKNPVLDDTGRIIGSGDSKGLTVVPFGAWETKKAVGESIRWSGEAFEKELNQVKLQVYQNLKKEITTAVPGTKSLMERYSGMIGAENSLGHQIAMTQKNNLIGVGDRFTGTAAAIPGLLLGGATGALGAAAAGIAARKALGSTASLTAAAQAFARIPPSVAPAIRSLAPAERQALIQFLILSSKEEPEEE